MLREIGRRFSFVRWPLTFFEDNKELHAPDFPLREEAKRRRFPFRAMRYWWAATAIRIHLEREPRRRRVVVVDAGCGRGILRRLANGLEHACWVGLDINTTADLVAVGRYQLALRCDVEKGIPLKSGCADVIVCLHLLEHLANPSAALKNLAGLLSPGGILLVGVPAHPDIFGVFRQRHFERLVNNGRMKAGKHRTVFSRAYLMRLAESAGLRVEYANGLRVLRCSGCRLEDSRTWVRLNLLFGAMFPAISGEICAQLKLRATPAAFRCENRPYPPAQHYRKVLRQSGVIAFAAACLLGIAALFGAWNNNRAQNKCPIETVHARHQDGNDKFYVLIDSCLEPLANMPKHVAPIRLDAVSDILHGQRESAEDAHFLATPNALAQLLKDDVKKDLFAVAVVSNNGQRFFLLSGEGYGVPLASVTCPMSLSGNVPVLD